MSLKSLKDCYNLTVEKLQHTPECPQCRFNPREEQTKAKPSLVQLEDQLGELLNAWTETLLTNFNDSIVKKALIYLDRTKTFNE